MAGRLLAEIARAAERRRLDRSRSPAFRRDRKAFERLAADTRIDLLAAIPHGTAQTYLREILLVADHNSYHVGQIVALRRQLGIWT